MWKLGAMLPSGTIGGEREDTRFVLGTLEETMFPSGHAENATSARAKAWPAVVILGQPVANVTEDQAVALIQSMIALGRPHHLVTVNPEFLVEARHNDTFRRVLQEADLPLADGVGITVAARLAGTPLQERIPGVDLLVRLACESARRGWRPFFLGGAPGVARRAAERLQRRWPALRVAGWYAGHPTPEETPAIIARVRRAAPDLLFVAYGHPKQDLWIARHKAALGVPVMMGVGGAFDYIAGVVPRAPAAMRRWGLEWLYRLYRQPWRWRRMLALPHFLALVVFEVGVRRWHSGQRPHTHGHG
ncbi:MAG: WecB/TagA/CpsF family glycosyltransferase [Ardenticatenia bacterium]|nr:WecB/TagA/CpsF family glycosyltransferase [Ardenticatenia bacterium]